MDYFESFPDEGLLYVSSSVLILIAATTRRMLQLEEAVPVLICLVFVFAAFALFCYSILFLKNESKISEPEAAMVFTLVVTLSAII